MTGDRLDAVRTLLADDPGAARLGIDVVDATDAEVALTMTVGDDMVNPGGTCHGGLLFALGDTALGQTASGPEGAAVTTSATITYLAPARPRDVLLATGRLVHAQGRSVVVDVDIRTADDAPVAVVRGHLLRASSRPEGR